MNYVKIADIKVVTSVKIDLKIKGLQASVLVGAFLIKAIVEMAFARQNSVNVRLAQYRLLIMAPHVPF